MLYRVLSLPLVSILARPWLRWLRNLLSKSAQTAIDLEEEMITADLGLDDQTLSGLGRARRMATAYSVFASIHCATGIPGLTGVTKVADVAVPAARD